MHPKRLQFTVHAGSLAVVLDTRRDKSIIDGKVTIQISLARQRPTSSDQRLDQTQDAHCEPAISSGEAGSKPSTWNPTAQSFPDGVEILQDCCNAQVDICFVHGLTGNRHGTWTASGQTAPWPKVLLASRLNKARILTYGYDAYVVRKSVASTNGLSNHAKNLLNDLTTNRAGADAASRPLMFVAHSLGGLVFKEAILLSRNNPDPHFRGIFDCTKGIAFMGTPHEDPGWPTGLKCRLRLWGL
ncbi:Protein SERAC1 [Tolypocladium ophioglossoides CBS 100239]|uniref:Protein SERAC1 n=1 Tax=Tolypocladium ophioglossoides (strain CBS 100239) TaxID=1163406 RepID=A0A0L0N4A1_TOLOC|nr:Protein SERAC1 [Tolypocladium ophioglossoides CBS 100239]